MASRNPSNPNFAAQNDEDLDSAELLKLREKCGRFRILVIGRANAGKTTLCQMMCKTDKPPIVHDKDGNPIDMSPSHERGIHDINNEITYEANPGFVFHDSGGFESGSNDELEAVRAFIKARSEETTLRDQLHAIWKGTDSVPVIAIFTKCDAQNVKANRELRDEGIVNRKDLKEQTQLRVESYLGGLADHIKQEAICKPKGLIFLKGVD
ncbi:hypothetical protein D9758_018324 [Tetrapyrgos nigripes]|uniref:G domain-containing protein n=1 Tax=Tetrapyrgos nigripes TaxID=182062 RepID=A0A8H5BB82_9AGAR|nr:hypothetical protein D9758_018324 [Tetrapyrgos nigripes]